MFLEFSAPIPRRVFSSINVPRRITLSDRPKLAKARLKVTEAPPTKVMRTISAPVSLILARLESKLSTVKGMYSSPTTLPPNSLIVFLAITFVSLGQL